MAGSDDDHSSLNLSLRLRRGSSDSRDSFYMDFDKGIDSDIDMEPCTREAQDLSVNDSLSSCEDTGGEEDEVGLDSEGKTNWGGLQASSSPIDRQPSLSPSPTSPTHILASPEPTSASIHSSQGASLCKVPNGDLDPNNIHIIQTCDGFARHRTINGHFHRHFDHRPRYVDALALVLSAMYAKMLVVMGIGFPLAEVISDYITASFFVAFYLYLYFGSILFLIYAYIFLFRDKKNAQKPNRLRIFRRNSQESLPGPGKNSFSSDAHFKKKRVEEAAVHCGSFYLRMGAVAFGIGSMIYSGLEFGQFFELDPNSACYSVIAAITPCTQMAFTFIQLYFIFLNSKMCIYKYKNLARFGLMHMVATNLCVWLHVLVQESKHEILASTDPTHGENPFHVKVLPIVTSLENNSKEMIMPLNDSVHRRVTRGIQNPAVVDTQCRRINIMGQLVQDASPFLFPCTIEYSLICAAILYIMWKNIGKSSQTRNSSVSSEISTITARRHQYSVDCAHANKGLFTGILVLVLAIISLILFFVLINKTEFKELAVLEAHVCELGLYSLCTLAAFIALFQVREMRYNPHRYVELDNILLIIAQTGVYLFAIFCMIGGHFTDDNSAILVILTALANLVQATVQTIFILDATRRSAVNNDQVQRKPGREMITFLLVCNFAMWAINSLETRRADSNPVQLDFYGFWAWTIISHVSTPLAIFFRFHSTVCLCEIWKKIYKPKSDSI